MFRILVLDKRDGIQPAIKYLLHRYELLFSSDIKDTVNKLNENNINMLLVNLPMQNGLHSAADVLKEWSTKKKIVALIDMLDAESIDEAHKMGAIACVDKMDVCRLPEVVDRYLNKAETRIIDIESKEGLHG